jgi:hypothetical protein
MMAVQRQLIILKYMRQVPTLATCERCHLKFFTPLHLVHLPDMAAENLWQKFQEHTCRPISFSEASPPKQ